MVLAVPSPRTWNAGDVVTSALLNAQLRDALTYLLNPPICRVKQTVAQSLTTGAWNALTFDTNVVDTYNGHSTSSNTSRYTAVEAGWYACSGIASFNSNATGGRGVRFHINGTVVQGTQTFAATASSTNVTALLTATLLYLNVGDYLELAAYQNTGGALSTFCASDQTPALTVQWVHA